MGRRACDAHASDCGRAPAERSESTAAQHFAFADPSQGIVRIPARRAGSRDQTPGSHGALLFPSRLHCAVVSEHGRYVRSAASYLCSSHVGSHMMFDALFEAPLAEYEDLYASYFRTYCSACSRATTTRSRNRCCPWSSTSRRQVGEWRKALIALTHSSPAFGVGRCCNCSRAAPDRSVAALFVLGGRNQRVVTVHWRGPPGLCRVPTARKSIHALHR